MKVIKTILLFNKLIVNEHRNICIKYKKSCHPSYTPTLSVERLRKECICSIAPMEGDHQHW